MMNSESLHHGNMKSVDVIIPLMLSKEAISMCPSMNFPRTVY